jgi:uncharacterized protein (DUF1330 family)
VAVTDPERYEEYEALTPAAIAAHGGRFIVRGGESEVVEGPPDDRRIVLIEFPDRESARTFSDSPDYAPARAARDGAAEMEILLVEGS